MDGESPRHDRAREGTDGMSDPRYIRTDFKSCLAHVVEECGELCAAIGKTQRWGWFSVNPELPPNQQETNIKWVQREMQDLREAMDRLQACIDNDLLP